MIGHHDQEQREQDGWYHWGVCKMGVDEKRFAQDGTEEFSDNPLDQLVQQGSGKKWIEYFLDDKKSLCYLRAIEGTLLSYSQ